MAASFKAQAAVSQRSAPAQKPLREDEEGATSFNSFKSYYSTVFRAGNSFPSSTGIVKKRNAARRRPPKTVRILRNREMRLAEDPQNEEQREGKQILGIVGSKVKRDGRV
ncbi:hypothetical protein YC2023_058757 [Brassica napus]